MVSIKRNRINGEKEIGRTTLKGQKKKRLLKGEVH
jgi:hypothetical protein